jgi:hypothetical protein
MSSGFRLLAAHFFGRFFDNDIVSQDSDMRTNVVQALGLLAVPGMFLAFYMLLQMVQYDRLFDRNWQLVADYYFFVTYSMVVMGFVMVFEWDALFTDRKDYLVLTPLPLRSSLIFRAKLGALLAFLGLFVIDANALGTALVPLVSGGNGTSLLRLCRLAAIHAVAVCAAGLFVALSFAGLQGLLINLLTGRAFRRISPWVQMASMALLILLLFLTPLMCSIVRPLFEESSPLLRWFPPFWFLALYVDLLPGRPGGPLFHELAPLATRALAISSAVFAVAYLAGYRRHSRCVMESLETAAEAPGRVRAWFDRAVNRWLLPHPLERASFHFVNNTVLRGARHRLFLATYAGLALALALPSVFEVGARPGAAVFTFFSGGLLVVPLTFSFLTVTGLRAIFNLPAELRANWIFQVCESEQRVRHIRAARKWMVVMGIVPLFALLAPFEIFYRGWWQGLVPIVFALLLSLVLMNLLLVWFRKIPFTCSYFPGKMAMAAMALIYLLSFVLYCSTMANLERALIEAPVKLALFSAALIGLLIGIARLERSELLVDDALIYEDQPEPAVRTLELG